MRKEFLLVFLFLAALQSRAQILDDTTRNVYSAATTKFTTQEQVQYETNHYFPLDTTIDNLHKFGVVDRNDNFYQNLGNLGTAVNPVFFTSPDMIGRTAGFPIYDVYFKTPADFRYYDTKSPYSEVQAIFAGGNRNMVDVVYSRNVNENWNVGFDYKRILAEKQLDRQSEDNRQALSTYYDLYTFFRTKNKRYTLLANAARLNQEVMELGGIQIDSDQGSATGDETFFLYEDASVLLNNAFSREYRFNLHLYHQYQLLRKNIQIFHELDRNTEKNTYFDYRLKANRAFYDRTLINPDTTSDAFRFTEFTNKVGLKGDVGNLFYLFFVKRRSIAFDRKYLPGNDREFESSAGFHLRWQFDSLHYFRVNGEYMIGGEHVLQGEYKNRFFEGAYKRIMSRPSYLHEAYFGNHNEWYNNFKSPHSDNIYAAISYGWTILQLKPFFRFSSVYNHIYFNQRREPEQVSGFAQVFSPGVAFTLNPVKNIYWTNEAIFTKVTGSSRRVFRYPTWFVNSSIYYKSFLFGNKLLVKTGLSAHYKSPYLAYAYDPVIQNYYLQDNFWIPKVEAGRRYIPVQAFVNMKIGNVRFFFRMEHLNQGDEDGYFVSPLFTAQKRTLNFGVNWMFFD